MAKKERTTVLLIIWIVGGIVFATNLIYIFLTPSATLPDISVYESNVNLSGYEEVCATEMTVFVKDSPNNCVDVINDSPEKSLGGRDFIVEDYNKCEDFCNRLQQKGRLAIGIKQNNYFSCYRNDLILCQELNKKKICFGKNVTYCSEYVLKKFKELE